jgi:hypothetical protein
MQRRALLASLLLGGASAAMAQAPAASLVGLKPQPGGQMRFFGFAVYDIKLLAAEAIDPGRWAEQRLALELTYARTLYGSEIAKRSLVEMRRQAEIADARAEAWLAQMRTAFPDVKAGDRITGLYEPGQGATFFLNGQLRHAVPDVEFARLFFGIWLSPKTSEPALRAQLLPGAAP